MKLNYFVKWFFIVIFSLYASWGYTQIPQNPTVQLFMTDNSGNPISDGSYTISVTLYDALTGGTSLWTETQTTMVQSGLVNLVLGEMTPLTLSFDSPYFVGVKIGTESELSPRLPLNPSTYSLAARAVYGSSNVFPDDGDVGIGTLTPMAKLDIEGKLRIADVPEIDTLSQVLVRGINDDKIVKSMPLDSFLHVLNKVSWKFSWWGWPGPTGPRGPVGPIGPQGPPGSAGKPGEDLVVLDSLGNVVFRVYAKDGKSVHYGHEFFKDSLTVGDKTKNHFVIFPDGSFGLVDKNGKLITGVQSDGTSDHAGTEYFQGGVIIGHPDSSAYVSISNDGHIQINNEDSTITAWNPDGTSLHTGLEVYKGGIAVGDTTKNHFVADPDGTFGLVGSDGKIISGVQPDGTSDHFGEEWFQGGITIGNIDSTGGYVRISPSGKFTMKTKSGAITTEFNPDGTSWHKGLETYAGGLEIPLLSETPTSAGKIVISPDPSVGIEIFNASGQPVQHMRPDGQAYHALGLTVGGTIVAQNLQVSGEKNFRIDDPLDPENKYLLHRSIESDERINLYNGNVILSKKGQATVKLPKWFSAINEDFRYQLTAVGAPAPHLYISNEIKDNQFSIAGGKKGMKVSWQITGIRRDAYAKSHPALVEVSKNKDELSANAEK